MKTILGSKAFPMHTVLLSTEELEELRLLVSQQGPQREHLSQVLAHPLPNLADFLGDIDAVVRRARGASRFIDEDFPELLDVLKTTRATYAAATALRKLPT